MGGIDGRRYPSPANPLGQYQSVSDAGVFRLVRFAADHMDQVDHLATGTPLQKSPWDSIREFHLLPNGLGTQLTVLGSTEPKGISPRPTKPLISFCDLVGDVGLEPTTR